MRNSLSIVCCALFSTIFLTQPLNAADAVYIGSNDGSFLEPSRWKNNYVPQPGDTAVLLPGGHGKLTIPNGSPFTLASILVNTNGANYTTALYGETNTLVAPAIIAVTNNILAIRTGALAGSDGFTFIGKYGNLELLTTNLFTGPVSVLSGRVLPNYDESFGPVPITLNPAAITLNGGMLGNYGAVFALAPTRGITAGPNGAYFSVRADPNNRLVPGLDIASPITGVGPVTIVNQSSSVMFSNPNNDYAGDTIFGENTPVGYYGLGHSALTLGANEVIPDTSRLLFPNGHDGLLDLNGHTETVSDIVAPNSVFAISNALPHLPGVLHTPISATAMNAAVGAGATLDLTGPGIARFNATGHAAYFPSEGTLSLSDGTLAISDPARLGGITLALNGGGLALEAHQPGLAETRFALTDGKVNINAINGVFLGVFPQLRWASPEIPSANAFGSNAQYLYEGEWYVPSAATYSFGKGFDDGACLIIDNQTLIENNAASAIVVKKNVPLTAGWHTIRLYFSNGGGSVGPRTTNGFISGILYDPANGNITNGLGQVENAYPFADPGDGSVLRTLATPTTVAVHSRLEINSDANFDRSAAPGTALAWAADIVSAPDATLTVTGGSEPFTVGSPDRPVVFEANISDANGLRFQDKTWIKTLPAAPIYGARADLAVGVPGILGTGAQTLTDYSLRLPAPDALGAPAAAPVTVNTGRTLTFDSTTEINSYLMDDPDRAFTASNAVTLAGGTLAFDGPGTVTLDAPVSGSGSLTKAGSGVAILAHAATFTGPVTVADGTLTPLNNDALGAAANPVILSGGALDLAAFEPTSFSRDLALTPGAAVIFPATPLALIGALSGELTKTSPTALTLAGSEPNPTLDLYVSKGAVTLATTPGPSVRNLLGVDTDASVTLGGADQISGSVRLSGGTLDLAGHDFAVDNFRVHTPSSVTNSGAGTATLTLGIDNTDGVLLGAIAPNIALEKQGTGNFSLAAVPGTSAPSSANVAAGTLSLGRAAHYVRLTILKTRTVGQKPRLGELVLTRSGYPLPYRIDATTSGSSSQSPYTTASVVDGVTPSTWLANETVGSFVTVYLKEPTVFDGYRLYSGINIDGKASLANDPVSWHLEISADNANWLLVDAVENAALYSPNPGVKIIDRSLDPAAWTSVPFEAATPVNVAAGATLRGAAPAFSVGTLSGAGTFDFLRSASATLTDVSAFTGIYSGAGELVVSGAVPLDIPSSAITSSLVGRLHSAGSVIFPPEFTVVRNAALPASTVIGASGVSGSFAGRLAEAAAPLGLTKVGAGKTTLIDTGSAYTGDTTIESGTLAINAGAYKFRYVRFNPTMTQNGNKPNSGYVLAISELQVLMNGQPVAWPSGTTVSTPFANHVDSPAINAINGALNNRWLSSVIPNPLTIDTQSGVSFDAYRFYDSGANPSDAPARCPVTWTVEGSDDGATWITIDTQSNVTVPAAHGAPGKLVGTFALRSSPRAWLPAQFRVETPATNQFLTAVTASKFCFQVLGVRTETSTYDNSASGYSLTALTLLRNGEIVPWPEGTTAWSPAPGWSSAIGNPINLVNNNESANDANRFYSSSIFNHVVVATPTPLVFDAYRWVSTYNVVGRDPTHWRLMVMPSEGGDTFYPVDEQVNYPTPSPRGGIVGPFPIRQPAGLSAVDAIPDTSRVCIAQGATLELGVDAIETVGPLSGMGTVTLADGATLGLNLFEDATFDGAISGQGTLALAGDHGQFFTSPNTIPGGFTVDFRGGRFGGTLHIGGALIVTGDVRYVLPEGTDSPYRRTLFTYTSIDSNSRAALLAGAASVTVPSGVDVKVKFTENSAVLSINSPGTIILVR